MPEWAGWVTAIAAILAIASGMGLAIIRAAIWVDRVSRDLSAIKQDLRELRKGVSALLTAHPEILARLYRQNVLPFSNPGPEEAPEKEVLLQKLEKMAISYDEAVKLKKILEEEYKKATGMALVAIGGLLALLDVIIEASQPPKIKAKGGK